MSMTDSIFIFVHIPRTGGTSLRRMMDATFGVDNCCKCGTEYLDLDRLARAPYEIEGALEKKAWYGHHPYGLGDCLEIAKQELIPHHYLTLLRDPRERICSVFRDHPNKFIIPSDVLVQWPEHNNMMVRMLGVDWQKGFMAPLDENNLALAQARMICGYTPFTFGLTEHYDDFLSRLPFEVHETLHINKRERRAEDDNYGCLEGHPGIALDMQLYQWAKKELGYAND